MILEVDDLSLRTSGFLQDLENGRVIYESAAWETRKIPAQALTPDGPGKEAVSTSLARQQGKRIK